MRTITFGAPVYLWLLAAPGVLKCPAPAKLLVADFEGLCKDVTWLDYSQRWGDTVKRRDLK